MTIDTIKANIDAFFGDMSRSQEETKDGLIDLAEYANMLAETIVVEDD